MKRSLLLTTLACLLVGRLTLAAPSMKDEPGPPAPTPAVSALTSRISPLIGKTDRTEEALALTEQAMAAARQAGDDAGLAMAGMFRAGAYRAANRFEDARQMLHESAAAYRRLHYVPGELLALVGEAGILLWTHPDEAMPIFRQACDAARADRVRPLTSAFNLVLLADNLSEIGCLREPELLLRTAVEINQRVAPESRELAFSLGSLGVTLRRSGDLKGARREHERALRIAEGLNNPGAVGFVLSNLAAVAIDEGRFPEAKELCRRALAIVEKRSEPDHSQLAGILVNLGLLAQFEGDLRQAEELQKQALEHARKADPESLPVAVCLNNLGLAAQSRGNLAAARSWLTQALHLREKLAPGTKVVVVSLNNLGQLASEQGDLTAARSYHERALAMSEDLAPVSQDVAVSLHELGSIAGQQGDLVAASGYYLRALPILERLGPESRNVCLCLHNLGWLSEKAGDLTAAQGYFERAVKIQEKLGSQSVEMAIFLSSLGSNCRLRKDTAGANANLARARELTEKASPGSLQMAAILSNLAALAADRSDSDESLRLAERAWKIARDQATAVAGGEERQAFGISTLVHCEKLLALQFQAGKPREALVTLEQGRAQALLQQIGARAMSERRAPTPAWTAYQTAIRAEQRAGEQLARAELQEARLKQSLDETTGLDRARLQLEWKAAQADVAEVRTAYEAARAATRERWTEVRAADPELYVQPDDPEQARRSLPDGTLVLSYSVAEEGSYVFASTGGPGGNVTAHFLPISAADLRQKVDDLRARLTGVRMERRGTQLVRVVGDRDAAAPVREQSRALTAVLLPPDLHPALRQARRIVISPDGPLWDLPFCVLMPDEPSTGATFGAPRYLGLEKPLTYTQSLTLFARSLRDRPASHAPVTALCVGDPRISPLPASPVAAATDAGAPEATEAAITARGALFPDGTLPPPLPFAAEEAQKVAGLYGATALTGPQATEAAVRDRLARADIIHLATHGYLHPVSGMSSGLLLAGSGGASSEEDSRNDGALQAWEIFGQLHLQADLVVLSACETGLGTQVRGEGLIGLTRAFQYAGARSTLASQWKVADASTEALMVRFHEALRRGTAKDEALRQAMAAVAADPKTAHPFFWAPFVLVGDPENHLFAAPAGTTIVPAQLPEAPPSPQAAPAPAAPRPSPAAPRKLDVQALTKETQKFGSAPGDLTMVWWLPDEFWRASLEGDPGLTAADRAMVLDRLRQYTFVMVTDGKIGADGKPVRSSEAQIRAALRIKTKSGTLLRPIAADQLGDDAKSITTVIKAALAQVLGPLGSQMHLFFFPGKNAAGQPLVAAAEPGIFTVYLDQREFRWRLPLASAVPSKICPTCKEELSGAYRFCPYDGTKLP